MTIVERRPPWNPELGSEWTTTHIAEPRYDTAKATWSLHWRGSDDRRHPDDRVKPSRDCQRLLAEIDADPTGIFWGSEAPRSHDSIRRAVSVLRRHDRHQAVASQGSAQEEELTELARRFGSLDELKRFGKLV